MVKKAEEETEYKSSIGSYPSSPKVNIMVFTGKDFKLN